MTLRTALVITGESEGAQKAVADVEKSMVSAESEAIALKAAYDRTDAAIRKLAAAQAEAKGEIDRAKAAYASGAATLEQYNREQLETKTALGLVAAEHRAASAELRKADAAYKNALTNQDNYNRSAKGVVDNTNAQRAGMQQLGFQLQDFAVQVAGGTSATRAFSQQMPQAIGAVTLMAGSTGKLGSFLGGPWGIALGVATAALLPLIGQLGEAEGAMNSVEFASSRLGDAQSILGNVMDLTTGKINTQSNALLALAKAQAIAGQIEARARQADARKDLLGLQAERYTPGQNFMGISGSWRRPIEGQVSSQYLGGVVDTRQAVDSLERLREAGRITEQQFLAAAQAVTTFGVEAENVKAFEKLEDALNGDTEAVKGFLKVTDRRERATKKLTDAERESNRAAKEAQQAYEQAVGSATTYAKSLEDQAARFGKSALEIQRMEVAAQAAAIEAAGLARGTADAAAEAANLAKRHREAGAVLEGKQIQKATDDYNRLIVAIYDEIEASGLVGKEREYRALQLEKESKFAEWAAQGLTDLDNKWLAYAAAKSAAIENNDALEKEREAIAALGEQIDALIGSFGRMGGMGGILGDLGGILTAKNPIAEMLGMGGLGTIAGSLLGGEKLTEKMGIEFTKSIKTTFPSLNDSLAGKIGGTLASVFQGAGIAGAVTGAARSLGVGKTTATAAGLGAGAAVGVGALASSGALGFGGAQAFLSTVGGPVGIAAAVALSVIAATIAKTTPRGGATIGAGGISGTWGNSQSRIETASGIGGAAVDALSQLASALGVPLGSFSSSISKRKNDLRFDPTGSGISKTSKGAISFGQDEQALMAAIVKDAISDGAFAGLSEGFRNYLTSGDVEQRLQDVLTLKGVQSEAAKIRDPKGFELGELDKWRSSMLAIATATGEGMADVEFVYGERRKAILEAANDDSLQLERDRQGILAQIAELEGRSAEALAITRKLEIDAAEASLRPLLERRNALQDEAVAAADAAAKADALATAAKAAAEALEATQKAIANELAGLERQWLEVTGQVDAVRALDLAALLSDEARAKQQAVWAYQDAQVAAANAAAAQETYNQSLREAKAAADAAQKAISDELSNLDRQWLQVTGQVEKLRELDLAALLSDDARARQQQIWAYEDAKDRQAEADRSAADAANNASQAVEDYARAMEEAQGKLAAVYQKERGQLEATRDKWLGLADSMGEVLSGIIGDLRSPQANYAAAGAAFRRTAASASMGDENAFKAFSGQANSFLTASRAQAGTLLDYQRDVALVARSARLAESNARGMASEARIQIEKLDQSVEGLIELNEKTQTVADLIAELNRLQEQAVVPAFTETMDAGFAQVAEAVKTQTSQAQSLDLNRKAAEATIAGTLSDLKDLTTRMLVAMENSGIKISGGSITVNNTAPIPVDTTP